MKKIKIVNKAAGLSMVLLGLLTLSSCLKNSKYSVDFSTVGASVDLPLAASNSNTVVTFSYDATVTSTDIPAYINLASPSPLGKPVTATMALDTAFLNSYNTNNSTAFSLLPDSVYTVVNGWNRTIPAGKRLDSMYIHFDFTKMDLSQSYVLPITIQSASEPIEQWNHLLINVSVKNQYDGVYSVTGTMVDHANGAITGSYPFTTSLITSGPTSVYFSQHPILSGGAASIYGEFGPVFNFDGNNNLTTVTNYYGQPSPTRLRSAQIATGLNKYNADGSIDASYDMYQAGVLRTEFVEHFTYVGPR